MRLEGQRIGRYNLLQLLGSGGMGEVYLAEDARIEQQVAIKVVRNEATPYPDIQANKEETNLFIREVKAIARLDHPNILPLFDYGEEHIGETKITYIVMPYRKEGSLASWLRLHSAGALLSLQDLAFFLHQAAEALQHAHEHAIIHQDVKPSNFLLRSRKEHPNHPDLLLADFGIAKFYSATSNASATIRGTPAYMAPEQWRGMPVFATDQYALAVMAYQLLVGRPPFHGGLEQIMYMHIHVQPPLPSSFDLGIRPRISPAIDTVLMRALEKHAADRFPSVSAFADAFQQASGNRTPDQGQVPASPPLGAINQATATAGLARTELRATLAISSAEAVTGTFRTLTLPGGRRVIVPVQAGAYNGQVIRLDGMVEQATPGTPAGTLVITLVIAQEDGRDQSGPYGMGRESEAEKTMLSSPSSPPYPGSDAEKTNLPDATSWPSSLGAINRGPTNDMNRATPIPPLGAINRAPTVDSTRKVQENTQNNRHRRISRLQAVLLVILVLLMIGGSAGSYIIISKQMEASRAKANATATALASVAAAATATASWFPYPPNTGTLVLNDPLTDNSRGYSWSRGYTQDDAGTDCAFKGGAYHVIESNPGRFYYCVAKNSNFSNFTFQVQMTFIQGSRPDYGGVLFRSEGKRQYFFRLGRNGSYLLKLFIDNTIGAGSILKAGFSPAIHTGLNVPNLLAVVAQGGNFSLYVNHQLIASANDTSYSQGKIALFSEDEQDTCDVAFNDAKVWAI
ncbi:MAG TPA: protein kinase [Ktedonobacteraceae bacterium]|nr:protein kinase [Ktedonobacteraceae bacterium]